MGRRAFSIVQFKMEFSKLDERILNESPSMAIKLCWGFQPDLYLSLYSEGVQL